MDADFTELLNLSRDLGEVPADTIPKIRQAVQHASFEAKKAWKPVASVSGSAAAFESSITYDTELNRNGEISAEIGPDLGRRGGGWGLLDAGGSGVLSAPQNGSRIAAKVADLDLDKGIDIALRGIL